KHGGYEPTFERVETAEAMSKALDKQTWDVIIADYVMPRFSGLNALRLLQGKGLDLPFILVSGTIGEDLAVDAMKSGAHDYIMKGNLKRLVPAIERELREAVIRHEQKKAEEALLESEKKYKNLVDNALVGIYKTNLKGDILYVNDALTKILEFQSKEEMMAESVLVRYKNPKDRDILIENLKKMVRVESFETELLTKTKKVKDVLLSALLDKDVISGMIIDITERKRAEEEIKKRVKELEEFYQMAIGRELKMIELKKEIERLNEELGRYKK
ncbi:MAG: response regulator, partial [Nitrospira sp.]|nr:response regulator [Nitrospira sp.]